MNNPD